MAGPLSVSEALSRVLAGAEPLGVEEVPLEAAARRVLAGPLTAKLTQPPFNASAMDGYAVRAQDITNLPATLTVIGEAAAGRGFAGPVSKNECVRIFTGAPLPADADAIVIQENTRRDGKTVVVTEGRPDPAHIRARGKDFKAGDALLEADRPIDARALTLAAAMGHAVLTVRRKPRVAILATGDELVPPGTAPGPGQIIASNAYGLAALVEAAGGTPHLLGIARDTQAAIEEKIAAAGDADVIVTIGGASVGDHDLVAPALTESGMTLDFWKIAMRPGKPMLFGRIGPKRVLGLPGNPVSSLVCGRVFLVPLIRALLGLPAEDRAPETAKLSVDLEANGPRAHYMRATLDSASAPPVATPLPDQDSALLSPLARAQCLIVRPANAPEASRGASVQILRLDF